MVGARGICVPSRVVGTFLITELSFVEITAKVSEVIINTTAAMVVILLKKVAAPLLPKRVWLDPPKAAPSSAPLPLWRRTTAIRKIHTKIWIMVKNIVI